MSDWVDHEKKNQFGRMGNQKLSKTISKVGSQKEEDDSLAYSLTSIRGVLGWIFVALVIYSVLLFKYQN